MTNPTPLQLAREALAFYAEEARYEYDETCCPPRRVSYKGNDILSDNGETARIALASLDSSLANEELATPPRDEVEVFIKECAKRIDLLKDRKSSRHLFWLSESSYRAGVDMSTWEREEKSFDADITLYGGMLRHFSALNARRAARKGTAGKSGPAEEFERLCKIVDNSRTALGWSANALSALARFCLKERDDILSALRHSPETKS